MYERPDSYKRRWTAAILRMLAPAPHECKPCVTDFVAGTSACCCCGRDMTGETGDVREA